MSRHNSVYDLTSLRIHADGKRVSTKSEGKIKPPGRATRSSARLNSIAADAAIETAVSPHESRKPKDSRDAKGKRSHLQVLDGKGRRIAEDAAPVTFKPVSSRRATSGNAKKRRKMEVPEEGENFENAIDAVLSENSSDEDETTQHGPSKQALPKPSLQRQKRRQVTSSTFHLTSSRPEKSSSADEEPIDSDLPSSDLLKSLHHQAVVYYSSHGQLYNSAQLHRRTYASAKTKSGRVRTTKRGTKKYVSLVKRRKQRRAAEAEAEGEAEGGDGQAKGGHGRTTSGWNGLGGEEYAERRCQPDMYKMFDGSALICLGMLVQEFVRHQINPPIPEGWNEEEVEDVNELETPEVPANAAITPAQESSRQSQSATTEDTAKLDAVAEESSKSDSTSSSSSSPQASEVTERSEGENLTKKRALSVSSEENDAVVQESETSGSSSESESSEDESSGSE